MPVAEITIDIVLVRAMLAEQHPDLADLPITPLAHGWDNEIFRLGPDLVARLPRRAVAEALILHERRWLGALAPALPLAVPAHVREGRAGAGYPWAWAIVPWFPGDVWHRTPPTELARAAARLAGFLAALHVPAPTDAPLNPFRGTPLAARAERFAHGLSELDDQVDKRRCRTLFDDLASATPWAHAPRWLHGDPHPLNLVVEQGELTAAIDFGDICAGDPASDLSAAWIVLPARARGVFRDTYASEVGLDDDTWARARAWALALGVAYVAGSTDHPDVAAIGRRAIAAALDD